MAFNPALYDAERYHELLQLAAEMTASLNPTLTCDPALAETLVAGWKQLIAEKAAGYVTPKVSVAAVVFNDRDELLLTLRPDTHQWLLPVGWADVGYTAAEIAVKEVAEETGLQVTPLRLMGVSDSYRRGFSLGMHIYSLVFYCRLDGGELRPHPLETLAVGFFGEHNLPQPLAGHGNWVQEAFAYHRGERVAAYFD